MKISAISERYLPSARNLATFARYVLARFTADGGLQVSGALTYTSLLGLIPLIAAVLAILAGIPAFDETQEAIKDLILSPLVSESGEQVRVYIDKFLSNTRQLTGIGAVGLFVTAILLLSTIEGTFNRIWRVVEPRPGYVRFLSFWAILTLGPLLLGASLSLSGSFQALANQTGVAEFSTGLGKFAPFIATTIGFTLLFTVIPNRRVRIVHAFAGALLSAILFQILKLTFASFFANSEVYRVVYGALAAMPVFLVWIYLSWTAIILGAQVTAALPEWRNAVAEEKRKELTSGERFAIAILLMKLIWSAAAAGKRLTRNEVEDQMSSAGWNIDTILSTLIAKEYVVFTEDNRAVFGRDVSDATLYDLQVDMGLAQILTAEFREALNADQTTPLSTYELDAFLNDVETAKAQIMAPTLKALFLRMDKPASVAADKDATA